MKVEVCFDLSLANRNRNELVRASPVREPLDSWPIDPAIDSGDSGDRHRTLEQLITLAVTSRVNRLRLPRPDVPRRPLSAEALEAKLADGRITWSPSSRGRRKPNVDESVQHALDAFLKGHFLVFVDQRSYFDLDDEVLVSPTSTVTFVRTTPLFPKLD